MRIIALSDVQGHLAYLERQLERMRLRQDDVMIFAGDIVNHHSELDALNDLLGGLPVPRDRRLFVLGNHEGLPANLQRLTEARILEDTRIEIGDISFLGLPWSLHRDRVPDLESHRGKIDVLVSHMPPRGILDNPLGRGYGGNDVILYLATAIKPSLHVFGHIHAHDCWKDNVSGTFFANVSICDPSNRPAFGPTILEVEQTVFGFCVVTLESVEAGTT